MISLIRRRPLEVMLGASVLIGWIVTFVSSMLPSSAALLPLIAIPVSYVPALLAHVVLRVAGTAEERAAFRRRVTTVRVGLRWYVLALFILPLVHVAGVALATLFGGVWSIHPALVGLLPLFLLTNLGEEIGWRGYALPKLQERIDPLAAALLLGFVWGAFHWVALLGNADAPWAFVAISTAHLMAMSVIVSYVFNHARESVPLVALVHAAYDTVSIGVLPLIDTGVPLLAFGLTAVVAWAVAAVCVAKGLMPVAHDVQDRGEVVSAAA